MTAAEPQAGRISLISGYSLPGRPGQAALAFNVALDHKKAGQVRPRQDWSASVAPGPHVLRVRWFWFTSRQLTVDVPAGRHVTVKTDIFHNLKLLRALPPFRALTLEVAAPARKRSSRKRS